MIMADQKFDDDPYWDNLKRQAEVNRLRSIPVCQQPGPGGICRLQMFHDGPHDFYPEGGVATALNEPLDYSTPSRWQAIWNERKTVMSERLQAAARAAHEANRILCLAMGDTSQPKWEDAPEWQKSSAIKGVQMILDNPSTSPEQSHEGWLAEKAATGWKYGPVKNPETKEHPCFVPYNELPENQRLKDEMFGTVVRSVLGSRGRR